ncbi:hypothetical protein [Maritimibacter alexandrii]|uniref:hypothetical protein n=1 Tax=Maritimibacter alexandrii TaxID=2570355 RepID=UPI0011086343|nr:hypothetical protein [Maritimibacter alexandrii]
MGVYRAREIVDHKPFGRILCEGTEAECAQFWEPGRVAITWHDDTPIRRWSPDAVAKGRKTRLRNKLTKKHPLFAEELYARELATRPSFYAGER